MECNRTVCELAFCSSQAARVGGATPRRDSSHSTHASRTARGVDRGLLVRSRAVAADAFCGHWCLCIPRRRATVSSMCTSRRSMLDPPSAKGMLRLTTSEMSPHGAQQQRSLPSRSLRRKAQKRAADPRALSFVEQNSPSWETLRRGSHGPWLTVAGGEIIPSPRRSPLAARRSFFCLSACLPACLSNLAS